MKDINIDAKIEKLDKSNKVTKILLIVIVSILIICLSFVIGFYFGEKKGKKECVNIQYIMNDNETENKDDSEIENKDEEKEQEENDKKYDYDTSMFARVTEDDFIALFEEEKFKDDKVYFVFSGRKTCSYSYMFLPHLQKSIQEYDYTLYYLDIDRVSKYDEISSLDEELAENISYTPMVYAVKNGKVIDVNAGYTEYSTLVQFLKINGVERKN